MNDEDSQEYSQNYSNYSKPSKDTAVRLSIQEKDQMELGGRKLSKVSNKNSLS